jgi:uncharacterized membrane protein
MQQLRSFLPLSVGIGLPGLLALLLAYETTLSGVFQPLRIALAGVLLCLLPGYTLQAALFPHPTDLRGVERAGLSFGMSIALIAVLALVIDKLPGGIQPWSILAAVAFVSICCGAIAWLRKSRASAYAHTLRLYTPIVPLIGLGGVLLCAMGITIASFALSPTASFSEFYLLGQGEKMVGYPHRALVGQPLNLTIGINNQEGKPLAYRVVAQQNGQLLTALPALELQNGESVQLPISITPPLAGPQMEFELLLFRADQQTAYRRLTLQLEVVTEP